MAVVGPLAPDADRDVERAAPVVVAALAAAAEVVERVVVVAVVGAAVDVVDFLSSLSVFMTYWT